MEASQLLGSCEIRTGEKLVAPDVRDDASSSRANYRAIRLGSQ